MASGTINGAVTYNNYAQIVWSSSAGTGGSTVSATLYWCPTGAWYFSYSRGYSLSINGNTKTGNTGSQNGSSKKELLTHSVWVSYTGNKSINISGEIDLRGVTYVSGNTKLPVYTASANVALDKVGSAPSNSSFTYPTADVWVTEVGTNITLKWGAFTDYSGNWGATIQVSVNGGSWTTLKQSTGMKSYTYSIPAGQGNKYRFRAQGYNDVGWSDWCYSGYVYTNILRPPTIGTISTFNPWSDNVLRVPLSGGGQATSDTFKRCADIYLNGKLKYSGTIPSNENTSVSITTNAQEITNALGKTKYSDSTMFTVVAWVQNGNNSKSNTVTKNFTVNINSDNGARPTINNLTFSGGLLGYPSTVFIAGVNGVSFTVPNGVINRGATGTTLSYSVSMDGVGTINGQSGTFDNLTAGKKTVKLTVTDSRGISRSANYEVMVQAWAKPSLAITSCERNDDDPTTAKLTYTMSYSPIYQYPTVGTLGSQLNNINTQQYKVTGAWATATNNMTITGLNTENTYSVSVRCSDKVKTTDYTLSSVTVPTINSLLSLRGNGVGIGCIPSPSYGLDVYGNVRFTGTSLSFTQYGLTKEVIKISGGDTTGLGIKIGGGGGTTIYSGEAGDLIDTDKSEILNLASDGQINFYTNYNDGASSGYRTYISKAGNLYCDKNISCLSLTQTSDERYKKDIVDIGSIYCDVWNDIDIKSYNWLNDSNDKEQFGIMAQNIMSAFESHGLDYNDYGIVRKHEDEDIYSVDYNQYHILTATVLKNTLEKVKNIEDKLTSIENTIEESSNTFDDK